jgi:hypothetical protein
MELHGKFQPAKFAVLGAPPDFYFFRRLDLP